ncbi:MAG: MazG nucleotide pyrophosphohydrolase domain-containing protein, partial [Dehalococcoidia bacterium]
MAAATSLDALLDAFDLAPHEVQAFDPLHPRFDATRPLLVLAPQFEAARPVVRLRYPPQAAARTASDGRVEAATVAALPLDGDAWLLPALAPEEDRGSVDGLRRVMERLFAPDGCPWDREQTPQTLRRYLLEETYEFVDAIDRDDAPALREELGDLFAHLFMQTALAQQAGRFTAEDVAAYAHAKFVRRHPHVFGDEQAESNEVLVGRWEAIKRAEREAAGANAEETAGALDSVPLAAPALQRTQLLLSRARSAGLGEPPATASETLRAAVDAGDPAAVLAAAVRFAAEHGVDAEEALRHAATRFVTAFQALEA